MKQPETFWEKKIQLNENFCEAMFHLLVQNLPCHEVDTANEIRRQWVEQLNTLDAVSNARIEE